MTEVESKPCFAGIDVSKETLDICLLPEKIKFQVQNNGDFSELLETLKKFTPELVVLEPTGGHEKAVLSALITEKIPVSRQHALRIYHHGKSRGQWAKSDSIDSETIAHYAQCYSDSIEPMDRLDDAGEELRQLVGRREDLVRIRTAEKNRLEGPGVCEAVKISCQKILKQLDEEIQVLEKEIEDRVNANEELCQKKALLLSVKGIGEIVANVLLTCLPELGKVSHKTIAALVGVAPFIHQSGKYRGERHILGGRTSVRCALYMPILSAIRHNPIIREYYQMLIGEGKKPMVAIVACMHKLLRIMNAMIAKNKPFKSA